MGLDPHLSRLPHSLVNGRTDRASLAAAARLFCLGAVDVVAPLVAAVKPQVAFFEALGAPGILALEEVVRHARELGLLVVLDAKRGDIGSTAEAYAQGTLDDDGAMAADSVTLSPYLGPESMGPFLKRIPNGKGAFVLVRTSNPGSGEWQAQGEGAIAPRVAAWITAQNDANLGASGFGPIGAVIGATVSEEASAWRDQMPNAWFLVPGFGAQGATADDVVRHARADGLGALITSSRAVLFPATGNEGENWPQQVRARCELLVRAVDAVLPVSSC